jgi:CDP-4-dehydro-6-deoxyglucose reductase, E3
MDFSMSFKIIVEPSNKQFECLADESILAAGIRQGVVMPYGCKNGACGSCKGQVLSGFIDQGPHQASALAALEREVGQALFCCARPLSDLVIKARIMTAAGDFAIKKLPCRVASLVKATPDVMVLKLQLPANEKFQYLAGQYIEFILRDGTRRSYSMGAAAHIADQLELHIRHMPGGKFTDPLFGSAAPALKEKDILRLEGPMGTFYLREDSLKPIIMLASGTGFAPLKAMVEHTIFKHMNRPIYFYWGARRPQDLYMQAKCEQWALELSHFKYTPVVSDALAQDSWTGRTGFVHHAVMQDFTDLSGYQVYACGAPIVVSSAQADFIGMRGLPSDEFFADSFTSAADL